MLQEKCEKRSYISWVLVVGRFWILETRLLIPLSNIIKITNSSLIDNICNRLKDIIIYFKELSTYFSFNRHTNITKLQYSNLYYYDNYHCLDSTLAKLLKMKSFLKVKLPLKKNYVKFPLFMEQILSFSDKGGKGFFNIWLLLTILISCYVFLSKLTFTWTLLSEMGLANYDFCWLKRGRGVSRFLTFADQGRGGFATLFSVVVICEQSLIKQTKTTL